MEKKLLLRLIFLGSLLLFGIAFLPYDAKLRGSSNEDLMFVPDEITIKFEENMGATSIVIKDGIAMTGIPSIDHWSPDWFIKLESGHSIQRTVILRGYSYFPTGEYIFEFRYDGKIFGMEKEVRELADGRYWLGPTRSNILVWSFKAAEDPLNNTTSQQILGKHNQFLDEYLHFTPTAQDKKLLKMDDMGD
jgi:hypothetical protein